MEQAVKRLAAVGFQVLDFNIQDWLFDGSPAVGDDWVRWVRRASRSAGLWRIVGSTPNHSTVANVPAPRN